jgi:hypothetical protein
VTATDKAAAVLFVVACVAELGSVVLIVREARRTATVLRRWQQADNPANQGQGTYAQLLLVNEVVQTLLDARVRIASAVGLLVVGIVAGTVGNFLTL